MVKPSQFLAQEVYCVLKVTGLSRVQRSTVIVTDQSTRTVDLRHDADQSTRGRRSNGSLISRMQSWTRSVLTIQGRRKQARREQHYCQRLQRKHRRSPSF